VAMGATVLVVSNLSGSDHGLVLAGRVLGAVVAGSAVYGGVAVVLGRREVTRQRALRRYQHQHRRPVASSSGRRLR
jgi:hypothetical protein